MDQQSANAGRPRHPSLAPVLLFFCGAVALFLVSVSHFVVSCLEQVGQAVEVTRRVYLPEVLHCQQDTANVERLHRFAAVVRHAADAETRRQAALHIRVIELNSSPARAAGARVRLAMLSRLIEDLVRLRQREDDLAAAWQRQVAKLRQVQDTAPEQEGQRVARLLEESPPWSVLPATRDDGDRSRPGNLAAWLREVEDTRQEARLVAENVRAMWGRCDATLGSLADRAGAGAWMGLDALLVDLEEQVDGLVRLASWLLTITIGVLLALSAFFYRHVVRPLFACSAAIRAGRLDCMDVGPHFRELKDIADALRPPPEGR